MNTFDDNREACLNKARAFFKKAEQVAETDNFDYAIDMYLEGLRMCPDALEDGHAPLRKLALIRQGKGGKKPSMVDKVKRRGGKTPLDEMLNAEYLLAKDPDCLPYAEVMLKAAVAGTYARTAKWIAQLVYDANRASDNPSLATWLLLKDSFAELGLFDKAVSACSYALEMRPEDAPMRDELRDLSARMTVAKGKYGQEGDFRNSIRDKELQDRLHSQGNIIKSDDFRKKAVEEARKEAEKYPSVTNIIKFAEALYELETESAFQEALELLEKTYQKTQEFTYKRKKGEFVIKKLKAHRRKLIAKLKAKPDDQDIKKQLSDITGQLNATSLEHFKACVENYPTDHKLSYELGLCYINNKQYDQAIPMFQAAQRDPKIKIAAMDKTALSFMLKGWYADAIDLFQEALNACEVKDTPVAKEIRYNLARSYEHDGGKDKALELYRKLAQLDFGFRDVSERINNLRNSRQDS